MKRAQNKVRRVLMLIDALAYRRLPVTIQDAVDALKERSGSNDNGCYRTIQRDIELLVSMDFVYVHRKGKRGSHTKFKMNLILTRTAQAAARLKDNSSGNQRN